MTRDYSYCSHGFLQTALKDAFGRPDPGPAIVSAAAAEAFELANLAYVRGDRAAVELAERLLYAIHLETSQSPPLQAVPSVIWGALMRAKLSAVFARVGDVPDQVDAGQACETLEAAVTKHATFKHPLIEELAAAKDLRPLVLFFRNWVAMAESFAHFLAMIGHRFRDDSLRRLIVENLSDELEGETHDKLRMRILDGLGTSLQSNLAIDDPAMLTEHFSLRNLRAGIASLDDPSYGLGVFFGIEMGWRLEGHLHYANLKERGIAAHYIQTLPMHMVADVAHADEIIVGFREAALSPRERARVVQGVIADLQVRWEMYDAVHRAIKAL